MCKSKLYPKFLLPTLCLLFSELKTASCDGDTFKNVVVRWCDNLPEMSYAVCNETTILNSSSIANDIPIDFKDKRYRYIVINNQSISVLHRNSAANLDMNSLQISSCGLTDIEVGAFLNTTLYDLTISYNRLKTLTRGIFMNATIRAELDLTGNGISTIEEGVFDGLNVGTLLLGQNNLTTVRRGIFENLKNVQILDLSNNQIKLIEAGSFSIFTTILYLQNNLLDEVPEGVFNSKVYIELILLGNHIKKIMPAAFNGTLFTYLHLTGNHIEKITKGMFNNHSDYILLGDNKIQTIESGSFDRVYGGVDLASNDLSIIRNGTFKYARRIILQDNKNLKKIEDGAFSYENRPANSYYGRLKRTMYLEKDTPLDNESMNYLRNLTSSDRLIWHDKVEDRLVFPL